MDTNLEMVNQITKSMTETIEKSLPEIVDATVSKKVEELASKSAAELEDIKAELKKMNLTAKASDPAVNAFAKKTAVVSIFKEVMNNNITTEAGFNQVVEATVKTMSAGAATEGAELVFDQFENDVLRVINTFEIVNSARILPLAKGDKVSLPKATNGITTFFTNEGADYQASDAVTGFVVIDIAKATTLTDMTQELLDDTMTVPDLYDLIVEFIGESQGQFLETQILTGTGSVKGILPNASVNVVNVANASAINDDKLVEVLTKAARKFKRQSGQVKRFMSQYVYGKIKALKTLDGYPLYPELRSATPSLMGYAVVMSDVGFVQNAAQDIANGNLLLFGDLKYFTLCRRKGLTVERGYYGDNWKKDIQSLKSNTRYGGTCTFPEALTIIKNS
jgi:HK97 family phage major capsid protein